MEKSQIEKQIKALAAISHSRHEELKHIGTLSGRSGIALFQFYCAKYFDEDRYADYGVEIISSCIDALNEGYTFPTYCNGIAGFGWTLQHLVENEFIELDLDELLPPFDDYLNAKMDFDLGDGNYDFLHGASGYAFYFFKRYKNSEGAIKEHYRGYLEKFVQGLDTLAIHETNGIKWESVIDPEEGFKGFNLSLSHGISSIIYILSKISSQGIAVEKSTELLHGATSFLLQQETTTNKTNSRFPNWIASNKVPSYNSRLAWCYGDIGIGKALGYASDVLRDDFLKKKSLATLRHAAERLELETTFVMDAGFCHGSFGNAHIFHKLYDNYKEPIFKKANEFWIKDGLGRYTGEKFTPFMQWRIPDNKWVLELNLLEGISGIGLSLIDHISPEKSSWDECFMLS